MFLACRSQFLPVFLPVFLPADSQKSVIYSAQVFADADGPHLIEGAFKCSREAPEPVD